MIPLRRRSIRLPGYDYSKAGAYYVTICARKGCDLVRDTLGDLVKSCWFAIPRHFPHVTLDAFVLMPDHLHGILVFDDPVGAGYIPPLHVVVGTFKAAVSRRLGFSIWQRNYYEHIVRNEDDLNRIRHYIDDNPTAAPRR